MPDGVGLMFPVQEPVNGLVGKRIVVFESVGAVLRIRNNPVARTQPADPQPRLKDAKTIDAAVIRLLAVDQRDGEQAASLAGFRIPPRARDHNHLDILESGEALSASSHSGTWARSPVLNVI